MSSPASVIAPGGGFHSGAESPAHTGETSILGRLAVENLVYGIPYRGYVPLGAFGAVGARWAGPDEAQAPATVAPPWSAWGGRLPRLRAGGKGVRRGW